MRRWPAVAAQGTSYRCGMARIPLREFPRMVHQNLPTILTAAAVLTDVFGFRHLCRCERTEIFPHADSRTFRNVDAKEGVASEDRRHSAGGRTVDHRLDIGSRCRYRRFVFRAGGLRIRTHISTAITHLTANQPTGLKVSAFGLGLKTNEEAPGFSLALAAAGESTAEASFAGASSSFA